MIIVGGPNDNGGLGAAWVFTRSGDDRTQDKLVGTGAAKKSTPTAALSADDGIAMVGRSNDKRGVGAASAFTGGGVADYQEPPTRSALSDPTLGLEE